MTQHQALPYPNGHKSGTELTASTTIIYERAQNALSNLPTYLQPLEIDPAQEFEALAPVIAELTEYHEANFDRLEAETPEAQHPIKRRKNKQEVYEIRDVYPENGETIRYKNIRPMENSHVLNLAYSILENGQHSECLADLVDDGQTVRVLAGQHRYMAVWAINQARAELGMTSYPLSVKVTPHEMDEKDILLIQVQENLQHKMQSHEKARAIIDMWRDYCAYCDSQGTKPTQKDFISFTARGLGTREVAAALQFGELDARVQALVIHGALVYTHSLVIGQLDEDIFKDKDWYERQFRAAVYAISANLSHEEIRRYVNGVIQDQQQLSFDDLSQAEMLSTLFFQPQTIPDEFRITFNRVGGAQALVAAGYFKRVMQLLKVLEYDERIQFTNAVNRVVAELIQVGNDFLKFLEQANPEVAEDVKSRLNTQ